MTRIMDRGRPARIRAAGAALLAALAAAGIAFPAAAQSRSDKAAVRPAERDVRIRRDRWGVPHVLGRTNADAAFGLAYAHAEDDYVTLREGLLAGRGKLAALKGAEGVESDWMLALMEVRATVEGRYEADLPAEVRAVLEAYAAGVNAYAAEHPARATPGEAPWTGRDIVAYGMLGQPAFYGLDDVFEKYMRAPAARAAAALEPQVEWGSNAVAVGPKRSADGATRLLVNSHQPFTGRYAWWEAVVESREGWHVAGAFFPGSPFLLGGHNANLGWAPTVNRPDLIDVYKLELDPADPDRYRLDGAWRRLDKRFVDIAVRGEGGATRTERREVLRSVHGPALRTPEGVFAIRYPGMTDLRGAHQYWRMNTARSLDDWRAAMRLGFLPSINYAYADDKGNIGFLPNARSPVRQEGIDWSGVIPGDRSELIPTQELPFDRRPQLWNPAGGLVFNANNTPFRAADPTDDLKPADFSPTLGLQTLDTNRSLRAAETYGADRSITAAEFETYKYDLAYSPQSDAAKIQALLGAGDPGGDAALAAAQAVVRAWDLRTDQRNRNAALPILTALRLRGLSMAGQPANVPPLQALAEAAAGLKAAHGRIDPEWGEVMRHRRGAVDLPLDGGPDILRAAYGRPDAQGRIVAVNGDTYFMFIEWDRQGRLSSRSIHQYGSATQDATSPHYADQAPLYAVMKTKPVLFTEAQLAGQIEEDYRPGQRRPR